MVTKRDSPDAARDRTTQASTRAVEDAQDVEAQGIAPAAALAHVRAGAPRAQSVLALQRVVGNRAVLGLLGGQGVIHRHPSPRGGGIRADAGAAVTLASAEVGAPLPEALRPRFERSLGADLRGVRVHTGADSAVAAESVAALAYTRGQSIHFASGKYDPGSTEGQRLLAHELVHTVQDSRAPASSAQSPLGVIAPHDPSEREADAVADAMLAGRTASASRVGGPEGFVHRYPQPRGSSGEYHDPDYPALRLTKGAKWNEYRIVQTGVTVYYDEGKYWLDDDGIHPADMSAFLVGLRNDNGRTYNYRNVQGTAVMLIEDVERMVAQRSDLNEGRLNAVLGEMQRGEAVHPIEIHCDESGRYNLRQGNHRLEAARRLRFTTIPVICTSSYKGDGAASSGSKDGAGPAQDPGARRAFWRKYLDEQAEKGNMLANQIIADINAHPDQEDEILDRLRMGRGGAIMGYLRGG